MKPLPTIPQQVEHPNSRVDRADGALQERIPPNLAERIRSVESELKTGLSLTHEEVLQRIRSWSTR